MNTFLDTDAAMQTIRPDTGLTPIGDIFSDVLATAVLAVCFTDAPCDFCPAEEQPTYLDPETNSRYCLPCLVIATEPLPEGPEDPALVAYAAEWIATRRAARTAA